jgi:hypothetical protein
MSSDQSLFRQPDKSEKSNYGSVNRGDLVNDPELVPIGEGSRSPTASRFLWVVAVSFLVAATYLVGLAATFSPSASRVVSADLVTNTNTAVEGSTTVSSSASATGTADIVHDDTALANDLEEYAWIHDVGERKYYFHDVEKWPEVSLDIEREQETINGAKHETSSLLISWSNGRRTSKSVLHDDDVVALQCGKSLDTLRIVKAATLSHVRDGHHEPQRHLAQVAEHSNDVARAGGRRAAEWFDGHRTDWFDGRYSHGEWNANKEELARERIFEKEWTGVNENEWLIDPVPEEVMVEPYCQAILCHMIEELEYVVVAESSLIRFGHVH